MKMMAGCVSTSSCAPSSVLLVAFPHVSNVLGLINPVKRGTGAPRRSACSCGRGTIRSAFPWTCRKLLRLLLFRDTDVRSDGNRCLQARRDLGMPPYQTGSNMAQTWKWSQLHSFVEGSLKRRRVHRTCRSCGLAAAIEFLNRWGEKCSGSVSRSSHDMPCPVQRSEGPENVVQPSQAIA
jgi:hypothetical protein